MWLWLTRLNVALISSLRPGVLMMNHRCICCLSHIRYVHLELNRRVSSLSVWDKSSQTDTGLFYCSSWNIEQLLCLFLACQWATCCLWAAGGHRKGQGARLPVGCWMFLYASVLQIRLIIWGIVHVRCVKDDVGAFSPSLYFCFDTK